MQTLSNININIHTVYLSSNYLIGHSQLSTQLKGMPKGKGKQSDVTKQASEPDEDMTQVLELLGGKLKYL